MEKVIVTPRSLSKDGHPYLSKITEAGYLLEFPAPGRQPTEGELLAAIGEAVGYLAGVEPITAQVLEAARSLVVISRNGTGTDNIDLAAAERQKIKVVRAEGANARGVAELAFGHLLAAIRMIPAADGALKRREWKRTMGGELEGKTLGLVGCGRIGKLMATFALAFGMRVLAHDLFPDKSFSPSRKFSYSGLEELLSDSDAVSLHCPPPADGFLIDEKRIALLKDKVIVINTARSSLIDPAAAKKALDAGKIACLTLDAFDSEPPDDWELVTHPGVIATPHIGGYTEESVERATVAAVDNLLTVLGRTQ